MAYKTDTELKAEADTIRDETIEGANTRDRIADMLDNIIDSKPNGNAANGRPEIIIGDWDLSTNAFPSGAIGSGTSGLIMKGNKWDGINSGVILGTDVEDGVRLRAKIDDPQQDLADWVIEY